MATEGKKESFLFAVILGPCRTSRTSRLGRSAFFLPVPKFESPPKCAGFPKHRNLQCTRESRTKLRHDSEPQGYKSHPAELLERFESSWSNRSGRHSGVVSAHPFRADLDTSGQFVAY